MILFHNVQPKQTLALKGHVCQGGKAYNMRIAVLLCCSDRLGPLIIGRIENPHCLKGFRHNPWDCLLSVNTWVNGRLFREWLLCFERKMFCKSWIVLLLMIHCATLIMVGTLKCGCLYAYCQTSPLTFNNWARSLCTVHSECTEGA